MGNRAFVLVYRGMNIGGIESLIVRLSNYLCSNGSEVFVVAKAGPLAKLLSDEVRFIEPPEAPNLLNLQSVVTVLSGVKSQMLFLSMDPFSRYLSECIIQRVLNASNTCVIKHVTGCFHPRAYFNDVERKFHHWLNFLLAHFSGHDGMFFMNLECRQNHAREISKSLTTSPILHIPVPVSQAKWVSCAGQTLRIATVGRIVPFKAYNFGLLDAAERMALVGCKVKITIYGHGEDADALKSEISERGLEKSVSFRGPLDYSRFEETVKEFDIFVGMGTAAMEAAGLGVPTILAIDGDRGNCYGYIQDSPVGSAGEVQGSRSRIPFCDVLLEYAKLSDAARDVIGESGREYIKSLSMDAYVANLDRLASSVAERKHNALVHAVFSLYILAIQIKIPKIGRIFLALK